jgi:hypothetical protein
MISKLIKVTIKKKDLGFLNRLTTLVRQALLRSVAKESRSLTQRVLSNNLSRSHEYSLARRTGKLATATHPLDTSWMGPFVYGGTIIGDNVPYSHVHVGLSTDPPTIITPQKAGALTIPLPSALTGRGVRKPEYNVGSLRSVPGLFILRKDGRAYLAKRTGTTGRGVLPLFVLRHMVSITKRVHTDTIAQANAKLINDNIEADMVRMVVDMRGQRVY